MKNITNIAGKIKLVTLKKFVTECITRRTVDPRTSVVQFNTLISCGSPFVSAEAEEISTYERRATVLMKGDEATILSAALISQMTIGHAFMPNSNYPLLSLFEEICIGHLENLGEPTHLVRVAPRTWLPANPKDYSVVFNQKGISLICYSKVRAKATVVSHMTLDEAMQVVEEIKWTYPRQLKP